MSFFSDFRAARRDDSKNVTQMDGVEAVTVNTPGRFRDEISARYEPADEGLTGEGLIQGAEARANEENTYRDYEQSYLDAADADVAGFD